MKRVELEMVLTRPARSTGADRYEADVEWQAKPYVIYIPQALSRATGSIAEKVLVTIAPME